MNHKWKQVKGDEVKNQLSRKKCTRCGLQYRILTRPIMGGTMAQYRIPEIGRLWQFPHLDRGADLNGHGIPKCSDGEKCPTCNGTGRVG